MGFFVDIGARLEMERKLRRTQEQLLQSEKLAAMGRLTSQLAHELNNPLYGIMNTLELMKTEIRPDNKRRRLLEMSLSETMRLADMLFFQAEHDAYHLARITDLIRLFAAAPA